MKVTKYDKDRHSFQIDNDKMYKATKKSFLYKNRNKSEQKENKIRTKENKITSKF